MVAWLRPVLWCLLIANALDITSSLIPTPADHLVPVPSRGPVAWALQLLGAALLVGWLGRVARPLYRRWTALPIPVAARWTLSVYLLVWATHVALRMERFPFSTVAMFSSAYPRSDSGSTSRLGYVIARDQQAEVVSFLREGSPWFARLGFGYDYKAGWAMHLYAPTHSRGRALLQARLAAEHLAPAVRARIIYSRSTGEVLHIIPLPDRRER